VLNAPGRPTRRLTIKGKTLAKAISGILDDKKGENIVILDVSNRSGIADYLVLVTGNSAPHVKALQAGVVEELKHAGVQPFRRTGVPEGGWMVVDYIDVVVHVFARPAREYYALETLWESAPRVN
jgi:ribosome-associated protein